MNTIKSISLYIVISAVIVVGCNLLKSDDLFVFLRADLIGLLLTLLAINIASLGLIASKIQDLVVEEPKYNFSNVMNEMRFSLKEQIVLIAVSIIALIVYDSDVLHFTLKVDLVNGTMVAVLLYAIHVLWDTGNGVFVIIEQIGKKK